MKKFLPYFLISILGIIIPLYFSYGSVGNPNETCSYDATGSPINSPCQAPGLGTGGSCSISLYTTQSACEGAIPPGVWTSLGNPTGGGGSCSNPQHTTQASCAAPETWTPQGNPGVGSTAVYNLLAPIQTDGVDLSTFNPNGDGGGGLGAYLNIMIKIFIGICAVLAVIMIVIGGLEYMTSELTESKAHGKESIKNAILGLLLALGAWTILNQINPQLLKTDLSSLQNATVTITADESPATAVTGGETSGPTAGCSEGMVNASGITVCGSIANNVNSLMAKANSAGISLSGGGYRSVASQTALRQANCNGDTTSAKPNPPCNPPTALPNTSRHTFGLAIDFRCGGSLIQDPTNACFVWLATNAGTYGLSNLPSEPWHWSDNGR